MIERKDVEEQFGPIAAIGPSDVQALTSMLYVYERWLWHRLPVSAQRTEKITEVETLLVKVALLGSSRMATMTYGDIAILLAAIDLFTGQLCKKVPQSKSRDDILESCRGLREYIATVFAPKQA